MCRSLAELSFAVACIPNFLLFFFFGGGGKEGKFDCYLRPWKALSSLCAHILYVMIISCFGLKQQIEESRLYPEKLKATSLDMVKSEERSEKKTTSRDMAGNIRSMMDFLEEF